jgi:hypothetical protein
MKNQHVAILVLLAVIAGGFSIARAAWVEHKGGRTYIVDQHGERWNRETGTLWYPDGDDLLGIQGVYFQRRLPGVPSRDTEWWRWERDFPDSRILK